MSTPTQLTEHSGTDSLSTPIGKGREGKGIGNEGESLQDQSCNLTVGALCSCDADAHPAVSYAFLGLEPIA